jgi:DivIVA domain-containing protein
MPDQSYAATEHALLEEIARPLERLADDPLELVQADFPTAMRGYDRAAVDDYVRETSQLVAELQAVRSPESAVRRALVRAGGQISGVLRRAHETAAEITARSRSEAEDRLERARVEADELMDAAERRVRDLDADTDRIWLDRQRIMADVEDLSNQLLGLAKQAGERFPDDDAQGTYDDEQAERPASGDRRIEPGAEEEGSEAPEGSSAWERWADHDVLAAGEAPAPEAAEAGEAASMGEAASTGDAASTGEAASTGDAASTGETADAGDAGEAGGDTGTAGTALTDREETLPLAKPDHFDLSEPPEVEPRSARLGHERASEDDRGDADPGSGGVIPPMSDAANRPRRT